MTNSQARHALIRANEKTQYCQDCGAQIKGAGAWGHDDNCPSRQLTAPAGPDEPHIVRGRE